MQTNQTTPNSNPTSKLNQKLQSMMDTVDDNSQLNPKMYTENPHDKNYTENQQKNLS